MIKDALLKVRVVVGAKVSEVVECGDDGVWKIRLAARPIEGAANAELIRFLGHKLGLAKRDVVIDSGLTSKVKRVRVGMDEGRVVERLMDGL